MTFKTFGEALRYVRVTYYGFSHNKLGQLVGHSKDVVRDWERGMSFPTGSTLRRILGVMPKIKPWMQLIPRSGRDRDSDLIIITPTFADQVAMAAEPQPPPPMTFGQHLARARLGEGLEPAELAELVGVTASAVAWWESDTYAPVKEHYDRILDLLPELRSAPEPDWRNIPPPNGGRGTPRDSARSTPPVPPVPPATDYDDVEDVEDPRTVALRTLVSGAPGMIGAAIGAIVGKPEKEAMTLLDTMIRLAARARRIILGHEDDPNLPGPAILEPLDPRRLPEITAQGAAGAGQRWTRALIRLEFAVRIRQVRSADQMPYAIAVEVSANGHPVRGERFGIDRATPFIIALRFANRGRELVMPPGYTLQSDR